MCSFTRSVLVSLVAFGAGMAHAGDDPTETSAALGYETLAGASGDDRPHFTRTDETAALPGSLPGYRNELTTSSYRWWMSRGRADFGLGFGTITRAAQPIGSVPNSAGDATPLTPLASATILTVGMRYRASERAALFADAYGVRGYGIDGRDAVVSKLGVEFKAAQSRWNIAYGGLGLRLVGDTNIALRLRRGGFAVYMRRAF